jgi:DNA-binding PadR family transcriptional regulator
MAPGESKMRRPSSSSLEFVLLGALAQKSQSGYDLRKAFAKTPMRHYSDSPGSIHPALQRLKSRRWVSALRDRDSARKREVFQITQAGKEALLGWLQEPFDRTHVMRHLDVLLLRFAFFDGNLSRRQAFSFLAHLERELGDYISELEAYAATSGMANSVNTGALVFSYGLDSYRALQLWARGAQESLSKKRT